MNKKQRNKRDGLGQPGNYLCQAAAFLLTFSLHPLGFSFSFSRIFATKTISSTPTQMVCEVLMDVYKGGNAEGKSPFFFLIEMG